MSENYWEQRRRHIENGAKFGGVAGMKAAERSWNARSPRRTYYFPKKEVTCYDCAQCYRTTMICQKFNKSVADNSVHPWECDGFGPRDE